MNVRQTIILLAAMLPASAGLAAAEGEARDPMKPDPVALKKWQDLRFGMFIHWGPVSLKGTEIGWSRGKQVPIEEYDNLYKQFNPEKFNADEWVKVARDAGMKYMVLTAKHHDGFCLWPSKFTDYHIGNSPFKRDVVKELSEACRKGGIQFCTYFSICDWYHPDYPLGSPGGKSKKPNPDMPRFYEYVKNQTRELIQNYGPLGIMWFDGEWEAPWTREYGNGLCRFLRELQPDLLINNRVSKGRRGMEGGTADASLNAGDYDTPEQRVGGFNMDRPWETCMTICHQWAWKPNDGMKSLKQCLQTLISTNGGNGNLLFNVGPMPNGEIEARQVERLKEMGAWLQKYGDTLYATNGGPYKPGAWGASTRKEKTIYLHIYRFDGDTLKLPALPAKVLSAKCLTGGEATFEQTAEALIVKVPAAQQQEIDTLVALELEQPAMDIAPIGAQGGVQGMPGAKATASNVFQKQPQYGPEKALDGDTGTRWATDAGTTQAWLEVNLGKPKDLTKVAINEWDGGGKRVQQFRLEYKDGEEWKTIIEGMGIGENFSKTFDAVKAQHVRLNILQATEGPTITEFSVK